MTGDGSAAGDGTPPAVRIVGAGYPGLAMAVACRMAGIEPKPVSRKEFRARIRARTADGIWQAGDCRSWYRDAPGRDATLSPGSVVADRRSAERARKSDYQ